jgi:hypothetical protein
MLASVFLLAAGSGLLGRILSTGARLLRIPARIYRHAARPIHHIRHLSNPACIVALLGQTALIWIALYIPVYLVIAAMIELPLSASEATVLLFAGALGLSIPAAPSGLGTFHAAIVSAFALLGRPTSEGLLFAVAAHGVFFVGLCLIGVASLAYTTFKFGAPPAAGEKI